MNINNLDYGITSIDYNLSCSFLSLKLLNYNKKSNFNIDYYNILSCFELLCSTNLRDLFNAKQKINEVAGGEFEKKYKFVYMALSYWANQNIQESRNSFISHLKFYKSDVVVYHMLHMVDFITGNCRGYLDYINNAIKVEDSKLQGYLNGIISFSFIENDLKEKAKLFAKKAVSENLDDIYSIHALVHCLHMDCDSEGIISYLESSRERWFYNNGMNMHIYWHLSLAYLNVLNLEKSFNYFKEFYALKPSPIGEYDLDAANYLWRLYLLDESNEEVMNELSKCSIQWAPSIGNSTSYFNDIHAMLCFSATDKTSFCQKLLAKNILDFNSKEANFVGRTILKSLYSFKEKKHEEVIKYLMEINDFSSIGGSYAQREIIYLTLVKSYIKKNKINEAEKIINNNFPLNFIESNYIKKMFS